MIQHRWFVMAALLCLVLSRTYAQKPLSVGDSLPSTLWNLPLKVVNHPEGKSSITLSEYKDKLIILDFWATWCGSCVQGLVELNKVREEYGEQVAIVPVSYETKEKIMTEISRRSWDLLSIAENSNLNVYFPHYSIPHQIWIKNGAVLEVTGVVDDLHGNIERALKGGALTLEKKRENHAFDPHELLTPLKEGYQMSYLGPRINVESAERNINNFGILRYNATPLQLLQEAMHYQYPFSRNANRFLFSLPDSTKDKIWPLWETIKLRPKTDAKTRSELKTNSYTYYYRSAVPITREEIFEKMRGDIFHFFKYRLGAVVSIEKVLVQCYVIIKSDRPQSASIAEGSFKYSSIDRPFNLFVADLIYENKFNEYPIIDESNCQEKVTIKLRTRLDELEKVREEIQKYGFDIIRSTRELDMVVLKNIQSKP